MSFFGLVLGSKDKPIPVVHALTPAQLPPGEVVGAVELLVLFDVVELEALEEELILEDFVVELLVVVGLVVEVGVGEVVGLEPLLEHTLTAMSPV